MIQVQFSDDSPDGGDGEDASSDAVGWEKRALGAGSPGQGPPHKGRGDRIAAMRGGATPGGVRRGGGEQGSCDASGPQDRGEIEEGLQYCLHDAACGGVSRQHHGPKVIWPWPHVVRHLILPNTWQVHDQYVNEELDNVGTEHWSR